jgi:glycerol-3-phosphate acyltransferase PlsY
MIQRIQSIWLFLAAGASLLSLKFSFYSGMKENNVFAELNGQSHFLLLILAVAVALISLFALFLFKKRKLQMQLTLLALLIQLGAIGFYIAQITKFASGNSSLTSIFTFVVPVFLILAWLGIRKDEKLIKSMDRLR